MAYHQTFTREERERFAKRVKQFRERHGVSQVLLAAIMGVGVRTIRRLESCEVEPSPSTILSFARMVERHRRAEEIELDSLEGLS